MGSIPIHWPFSVHRRLAVMISAGQRTSFGQNELRIVTKLMEKILNAKKIYVLKQLKKFCSFWNVFKYSKKV